MNEIIALIPEIMQAAITKFNEHEMYLIRHNVSERCICAKFACYLERELYGHGINQYNVDVEYNRSIGDLKVLRNKKIVVDMIVHKRGSNGFDNGNLICIEMKKSCNRYGLDSDKHRLQDLVSDKYGYLFFIAYMVVVDMNHEQRKSGLRIESEFRRTS